MRSGGAAFGGAAVGPDTSDAGIADSSRPTVFNPDLLQYSELLSADPAANEGRLVDAGLEERNDSAAADEPVEREGKTDPRILLTLSREASFLTSRRNLEGFRGGVGAGRGFRSTGT
jgi:hypothetical protein